MSLEIIEVTKRFGQATAVDHLTLTVPEGEMFGLLGANGAGKTTNLSHDFRPSAPDGTG